MNMILMIFPLLYSLLHQPSLKIDFGENQASSSWYVVNDGVMGGLSESKLTLSENSAILEGKVSLKNNGGFASFRSPFESYDLSSFSTVEIRYRSKGQDVALVLALHQRWYLPNYKIIFAESNNEWHTLSFKLANAKENRLGQFTGKFLAQDQLSKIIRLGFMTNSKKEGSFHFEVDYLLFK